MSKSWRGIFAIVVTPFTDELELDEAALRRQIGFCIEAGAAGLVGPANAGEFAAMSDEERHRWIRIVVEEVDGRVPVVAATTHGHRVPAVALSRYAQDVGADGIMAMPPHILHPDADGCYDYYRHLMWRCTFRSASRTSWLPSARPCPPSCWRACAVSWSGYSI